MSKNITVVGATGQIGRRVVDLLTAQGHHVTAASRQSGVDAALGTGLAEALAGADVLIDVLNSPSLEDDVALAFFTGTSANLSLAAKQAGVGHYVLLSIVGIDTVDAGGYLRAKVVQEKTVAASGVPYTVVRAAQFHEFTSGIVDSLTVDDEVRVPDAMIQPIAADEVSAVVARIAQEAPLNGVHDVAGPEPMSFADLAATVLAAQGNDLPIVVDPTARYFGVAVEETSLIPAPDAERGATRLADWLASK